MKEFTQEKYSVQLLFYIVMMVIETAKSNV